MAPLSAWTPAAQVARRQGNADLWPVLPVGAGTARRRRAAGRTPPQLRGGSFSAGIPAFGVIRTLEWQTPFAALWAPCLRPVKADDNEPPAVLRAAVPAPTGRTGRRSAFPDRRRHLAWWRTCETCSFTATSWQSVSPIRHAVRSVGRDPRFSGNRLPRQQVAVPWGALRSVRMRNTAARRRATAALRAGRSLAAVHRAAGRGERDLAAAARAARRANDTLGPGLRDARRDVARALDVMRRRGPERDHGPSR